VEARERAEEKRRRRIRIRRVRRMEAACVARFAVTTY
jgi:hypothetical protein